MIDLFKKIFKKLKHIVIDNELLTQTQWETVRKEDAYRTGKTRQLFLMERGFDMGYGQADWKREDLHERL